MGDLVWRKDRILTAVSLVIGILFWAAVAYFVFSIGGRPIIPKAVTVIVLVALFSFLIYVFMHSAFIAHFCGNGVEVTETQFPDLHEQFRECCARVGVTHPPRLFVTNGNGVLNAFATWFLGRKFVVLLSNVVDAMDENPSGARFYMGHELGHVIRHDNVIVWLIRWPALRLPLLGAAYSRARETTCDMHGAACSKSPDDAGKALSALLAGSKRWQATSLDALKVQAERTRGFWSSFHELVAGYPWTIKRVLRVQAADAKVPRRNPFAYLLAIFVPYAGPYGAGIGFLIYVYVIGVMAAIAIPAYQDYTTRAVFTHAMDETEGVRKALAASYQDTHKIPQSLDDVGAPGSLPDGTELGYDNKNMTLVASTSRGDLLFMPKQDDEGEIIWKCVNTGKERPAQLPLACR